MKVLVTPSILSADFGHFQDAVDSVASAADWIQLDVIPLDVILDVMSYAMLSVMPSLTTL